MKFLTTQGMVIKEMSSVVLQQDNVSISMEYMLNFFLKTVCDFAL